MAKKYYAVLLYENEFHLGISNNPNKWLRVGMLKFENGAAALNTYAEIPCPASQLIDAPTPELLNEEIRKMDENFTNDKWLNENLYPYI